MIEKLRCAMLIQNFSSNHKILPNVHKKAAQNDKTRTVESMVAYTHIDKTTTYATSTRPPSPPPFPIARLVFRPQLRLSLCNDNNSIGSSNTQ